MKTFKRTLILSALGLMALPSLILAGGEEPPAPITDITQAWGFLLVIRNWIFALLGVAVVIMLLVAAYKFITASGDGEKIETAREMIKYALIGVAVMLLAGGVVAIVQSFIELAPPA